MWMVGSLAAAVGMVTVVVALVLDPAVPARERPRWPPGVPAPAELRRLRFPLVWRGYDPVTVDARLAELAERYEALYRAAGPAGLARAEARLAGGPAPGAGVDPSAVGEEPSAGPHPSGDESTAD